MANSVFCIASTQPQAIRIVSDLKSAGFIENDISVLLPDKSGTRDFAHEQHTKAPEGAAAGAGAGGVLGGVAGLLAGIGLLAIPGLGPFIAAGPIMAALGGVAVGATVGGLAGALIGLGMPEIEAKAYEGKVRSGNILLSCHVATAEQQKLAKDIFKEAGATDIAVVGEKTPPKQNETRAASRS
jgi:hypothetical protein